MMNVGCIIQARIGSTRLPEKVFADIGGWLMIRHVMERMDKVGIPVVLAVPYGEEVQFSRAFPVECSENDVLQRYLLTAQHYGFDAVMRVTGDCPLIDPFECSRVLGVFNSGHYDYVANDVYPSFPDGLGCEVFTKAALEEAHRGAKPDITADREHVTPWIKRGLNLVGGRRYCGLNLRCPYAGLENLKFSVDTQEDLDRVRAIDALLPDGLHKFRLDTTLEAWRGVCAREELVKQAQALDMGYGTQ